MNPKENERIAVCRILLDVADEMGGCASISDCRHYQQLKDKTGLTELHFELARKVSVLTSLVAIKQVHYNTKMLLALTICDLYSEYKVVPINLRLTFETLMHTIDWPISFTEMLAKSRSE